MSNRSSIILLFFFAVFYVIYGMCVTVPSYTDLRIVGSVGLAQFLLSIYSSLKNGQKLISPCIIFLIVLYVFHVGQSLMYPFDIVSHNDLVGFLGITIADVFSAQLVSFAFIAFFQIGALLYKAKDRINNYNGTISAQQEKRLIQIGWFLALISAYSYYQELISNAILSLINGYGALYEREIRTGLSNLQAVIADYFIPSIICLYIGYRKKKLARIILMSILLINCLVILIIGGRSEAVIILGLLLILRNYLVRPFTRKEIAIIGGGAIFVLILLSSIAQIRSDTHRSLQDTLKTSNNKESPNGVVSAIGEMGGSMFCQIWTKEILSQTKDYRCGSSYAYAFTSLIPNLGFWSIHPAKVHADLGDWLTNQKGLTFGTGYSMVAEAYINFGYFGCLIMMLWGYLAARILGQMGLALERRNIAYVAFVLVFFWFALKIPRNSFIGIVRAVFYFSLPIYWYTRGYILKISHK